MRVLLSTIGSRGDVQPLVALALALRSLGQEVRLCVPPDFREWIEGLGLAVTPIGPELRSTGRATPSATPPTPEQRRQMVEASVATQFETIAKAAEGCDVIVGATALQIAAPSVAERMGIPYVFAAYCPTVLPSPHHPPPVLGLLGDTPEPDPSEYAKLWAQDSERFSALFGGALNLHRASLGLSPIHDVRSYVHTDRPWLASDPTLGPWPDSADEAVLQTGAWILPDAASAPRGAGGVPRCRRAARLLRLRKHPRVGEPEPGDDRLRACARTSSHRLPRVGRPVPGRRRARLPGDRRGQPPGALPAGRGRRPPRRRGNHDRRRASRSASGRHPPDVRPALLGPTRRPTWYRSSARSRRTDRRLADEARFGTHSNPTWRPARSPSPLWCAATAHRLPPGA